MCTFIQTKKILFPYLKKCSTESSTLSDCDLEGKYLEEEGFSDCSNSLENLSQLRSHRSPHQMPEIEISSHTSRYVVLLLNVTLMLTIINLYS